MVERRTVLAGLGAAGVAAGLGFIWVEQGGKREAVTPEQARANGAPLRTLNAVQARALEALGEVLLPGARQAGIANFVDHHISVPAPESLLMIRYMDVPAPYAPFYEGGLAALDALATARHSKPFSALDAGQANALVGEMSAPDKDPAGWRGPPASLFYFVTRSDAVDVVYGTEKGFEKLGVPYMAHLIPETPW